MSKILKDSTYNELMAKATAFDRIIGSVQNDGADEMSVEEYADAVVASLDSFDGASEGEADGSQLEAVQALLDEANAKISDLQSQLQAANDSVTSLTEELNNVPAEKPAPIVAKSEVTASAGDIASFADKNEGDTFAILDKLKEEGLI